MFEISGPKSYALGTGVLTYWVLGPSGILRILAQVMSAGGQIFCYISVQGAVCCSWGHSKLGFMVIIHMYTYLVKKRTATLLHMVSEDLKP